MITLDGSHFIYNDVHSTKYKLIFARVETSPVRSLAGKKTGKFVFDKATKARYHVGDDYSQSHMTFDVEIVTCDGQAIELQALREIERWLFANSSFKKLYIDPIDDPYGESYELAYGVQKSLYFNCRFLYPEKLEYNGGVVGFKCTMETDSMLLWQDAINCAYDLSAPVYVEIEGEQVRVLKGDVDFDGDVSLKDALRILQAYRNTIFDLPTGLNELETVAADYDSDGKITLSDALTTLQVYSADLFQIPKKKEYTVYDPDTQEYIVVTDELTTPISLNIDTDIDGYTYPVIKFMTGPQSNVGVIKITNLTDDDNRVTEFSHIPDYTTVEIDCAKHTVTGGNYNRMTKKVFPRLLDGINNLEFYGSIISLEISWNNRRFM